MHSQQTSSMKKLTITTEDMSDWSKWTARISVWANSLEEKKTEDYLAKLLQVKNIDYLKTYYG